MKETGNRNSISSKLKVLGHFKNLVFLIIFQFFQLLIKEKEEHAIGHFYVFFHPLSTKNIAKAVKLVFFLILENK